jgi:type II pantothenate kinase
MKILGLDRGASSTKAVILNNRQLIFKQIISPNDSLPACEQKFCSQNLNEFECNSRGALFLTKLNSAVVVSCGTGTSVVWARKNKPVEHLGGTGIGGGTLLGLGKLILKTDSFKKILALAATGNQTKVNLTVGDVLGKGIGRLPPEATAANFGQIKSTKKTDFAAALVSLVAETIAMVACLAAKPTQETNLVFIGRLATNALIQQNLSAVCVMYNLNPLFPKDAAFATALGAALFHQS